jgi:drug/metabolite transporter (DMT)-like permease
MLYLLGSIIFTSYLTLSFKVLEKLGINVFQAIVINYCTCVVTGSVVNGKFPFEESVLHVIWFKWALLMGAMFVTIFNILGLTTRRIGVAVASVANKLSMVIPFVFSIYLYKESITWLKFSGIVTALIAVLLTCWRSGSPDKGSSPNKKDILLFILLPAILFLSSGMLDTLIKFSEQTYLNDQNKNSFLVIAFAVAASIGLIIMTILAITGRLPLSFKSVIAGICIGIPNYFSIWCLIQVLKDYRGNSSGVIPVNNMGIVLFSAVMAWVLFKERLSIPNWMGIVLSVAAIALIAFG